MTAAYRSRHAARTRLKNVEHFRFQVLRARGHPGGQIGDVAKSLGAAAGGLLDRQSLGWTRSRYDPAAVWMLTAISPVVMLCSSTADGDAGRGHRQLVDRARDRGDLIDRFSWWRPGWLATCCEISSVARDGLIGECLHFGGDHRESLAGVAGARRFDGRVERQQDWFATRLSK